MKLIKFFFLLPVLALFTSCVDIFDEIVLHQDGSGTYKYTLNLSASKVKINSLLALDSLDGQRIPKIPEIKDKIKLYTEKLEQKEGISNVKVDANYDNFIFKFSCDFTSVNTLQTAIKEILKEEIKDKNNPLLNENWVSWDGKQLVRNIPNFTSPISKLKAEDKELLKNGKYIAVSRFDKEVVKCDNANAQISPSKTAVMVKASTFQVASNPSLLKSSVTVAN